MDYWFTSKSGGSLQQRGRGLHQYLSTKERRNWDLHVLDWYTCCAPLVKLFYGDLWRHRPHPCPRKVNTFAYSKGRRREAAILIQHMVRWRLTRGDVLAPFGTTMTVFDASNAFMSVHHTTLDKLVETSFEDERDRALMKQRYREAQISFVRKCR